MASSQASGVDASGYTVELTAGSSTMHGSATTIAANPTSAANTPHASESSSASAPTPSPKPQDSPEILDLLKKFQDFDDKAVYDQVKLECQKKEAMNFVVQFGVDEAKVACNLDHRDFDTLMKQRNVFGEGKLPVRWINIWNPSRQRSTIKAIGKHYNFSKRLILSIWAWDAVKEELIKKKREAAEAALLARDPGRVFRSKGNAHLNDLENGVNGRLDAAASSVSVSSAGSKNEDNSDLAGIFDPKSMATFAMMQKTIDYTSIDLGPRYTVLSFHESYYESFSQEEGENNPDWATEELKSTRDNTLKVFRQLSKQGQEEDKHKIMQLTSVRESMSMARDKEGKEGACNIFYYLFEDYSGAMFILGSTKAALDVISKRVLRTAEWRNKDNTTDIIPKLYKLNKELRELRHLFTNYNTLISKIINKDLDEAAEAAAPGHPVDTLLSYSALNRFKRLQVQLQSLMLDTIKDYLDEKESLQDTIPDLTEGYTKWSYWGSFAVIAGVSFMSLFFFSKVLMFLSDWLDHFAERVEGCFKKLTGSKTVDKGTKYE
ncbi:ADP-ribosylation factor [Grosmannia clavigera kw1407]|uniref:ADP-ribosylation factor n=1 Tax=Grosmannia clavigera (strain kw1407 / UAMH 11150) TaxID=655863 RepID=F0X9C5_GROCL|nr:ADP-ribosylation factor [Grosmannia clavigera kw1407]EFX06008.1 ADP-ribosylation factor [Grosmannia clavigera kw1407]